MNIFNTIKNKNLQSVAFLTSYNTWANNLNITDSKLVNKSLKITALALSIFVLIGSVFIFISKDVPMLIKDAYNSLTSNDSNIAQILKPLFVIGVGFLAYNAYEAILNKINYIKKNALAAGAVTLLVGVGISAYSMGYLPI